MVWIDYKKAVNMVPHSWIKECLDLFGVAGNIKSLLANSMENWIVMLCARDSEFKEVDIKRGIFQGDSLSPLVFCFSIDPINFDFKKDQGNIFLRRQSEN